MIRAVPLYTFLNYCNSSPLEKVVLECGAGVMDSYEPLLVRFFEHGYTTYGLEISNERLQAAQNFCKEHRIELNISKGDMRNLPFENESLSFIYSYNSIFHMTKANIAIAMQEITRVLKKDGRCFINFLSLDDDKCGVGQKLDNGEFVQDEGDGKTIHTYYADDEPDIYFSQFNILRKDKRIVELFTSKRHKQAYIDYIAEKK